MSKLRTPRLECDKRVLLIVVLLMAVGASLVASSSSYFSSSKFDDPYFLLKKHIVRLMMAGLFLFVATHIDYRVFRKLSPVAFATVLHPAGHVWCGRVRGTLAVRLPLAFASRKLVQA